VNSVQAYVDGETYLLTNGGFNRDNNTSIWEWKDDHVSINQISVLMKMAKGNDVVLRFNGQQYKKDIPLSHSDKIALAKLLEAYGDIPE